MGVFDVVGTVVDIIGIAEPIKTRFKREATDYNSFLSEVKKIIIASCKEYHDFIKFSPDHRDIIFLNEYEDMIYDTVIASIENSSPFTVDNFLCTESEFPLSEKRRLYEIVIVKLKTHSWEYFDRDHVTKSDVFMEATSKFISTQAKLSTRIAEDIKHIVQNLYPDNIERIETKEDKIQNTIDVKSFSLEAPKQLLSATVLQFTGKYITYRPSKVSKEFSYRDTIVAAIEETLKMKRKVLILSSIGGVGKTAIARKVFYDLKDDFEQLAWVRYTDTLKQSLIQSFDIARDVSNTDERFEAIKYHIQSSNILLIIDNVTKTKIEDPDLAWFEQDFEGSVLITTRVDGLCNQEQTELNWFTEELAVEIFYSYYKKDVERKKIKIVKKIVNLVRYHTLSVELLAKSAIASELDGFYRMLIEKGIEYPDLSVITDHSEINDIISKHLARLYSIINLSDRERAILKIFVVMPQIEIPHEINKWIDKKPDDIISLCRLGWLQNMDYGYYLHDIIRHSLLLQNIVVRTPDLITILVHFSQNWKAFPSTDEYCLNRRKRQIALCLFKQFEELIHIPQQKEKISTLKILLSKFNQLSSLPSGLFMELCESIGIEYFKFDDFITSEKILTTGIKLGEEAIQKNIKFDTELNINLANLYISMANVLKRVNKINNAMNLLDKAEEKAQNLPEVNSKLIRYNILRERADGYRYQKLYDKALIQLKFAGDVIGDNSNVDLICDVGLVNEDAGDLKKALSSYLNAVENYKKKYEDNHPVFSWLYNRIANIYNLEKNYDEALTWIQKAIPIYEKRYG